MNEFGLPPAGIPVRESQPGHGLAARWLLVPVVGVRVKSEV